MPVATNPAPAGRPDIIVFPAGTFVRRQPRTPGIYPVDVPEGARVLFAGDAGERGAEAA